MWEYIPYMVFEQRAGWLIWRSVERRKAMNIREYDLAGAFLPCLETPSLNLT